MEVRAAFVVLLLSCCALEASGARTEDGDLGSWFGSSETDATTPIGDRMESVPAAADNDTVDYEDEYLDGDTAEEGPLAEEGTPAPNVTASHNDRANEIAAGANGSAPFSKGQNLALLSRNVSAASKGTAGKIGEVNYWQTDGAADQQRSESSTASGADEGRDEQTVSVKEHDRNPNPAAFSSGDGGWFGFGGGPGGGSSASAKGWQSAKGSGGSSPVAVEDYQSKEQSASARSGEQESVVEIKEHDEVAPGGFAPPSSDGQWFGGGPSNSKSSSSSSGGSGGDDVWFGVAASDWQPVALSSHRQQRKLNWNEDPVPTPRYEEVDIITAPPDSGKSRDVFSFVVESSFGEPKVRGGSAAARLLPADDVEIITAPPGSRVDSESEWFAKLLSDERAAPQHRPERNVTTTAAPSTVPPLPSTVLLDDSTVSAIDEKHSFAELLAKKTSVGLLHESPPVVTEANWSVVNKSAGRSQDRDSAAGRSRDRNSTAGRSRDRDSAAGRSKTPSSALPERIATTTKAAQTTTPVSVPKVTTTTVVPESTTTDLRPDAARSTERPGSWYVYGDASGRGEDDGAVAVVVLAPRNGSRVAVRKEEPTTGAGGNGETTQRARSGRTYDADATTLGDGRNRSGEKGGLRPNFTASAASSSSESRPVADSGALRRSTSFTMDNLSYILVGTCCGVCMVCLAVAGAVLWHRRSRRRHRHALRSSAAYSPTPYSAYPPASSQRRRSAFGHFNPSSWLDRSRVPPRKTGPPGSTPPTSKGQLWFVGPKQSPYSLCDQHLGTYCANGGYGAPSAAESKSVSASPAQRRDRSLSASGLQPSPTVYRSGFNGVSNLRHSSGLEYMNKGEMIYWSSNNEQLI